MQSTHLACKEVGAHTCYHETWKHMSTTNVRTATLRRCGAMTISMYWSIPQHIVTKYTPYSGLSDVLHCPQHKPTYSRFENRYPQSFSAKVFLVAWRPNGWCKNIAHGIPQTICCTMHSIIEPECLWKHTCDIDRTHTQKKREGENCPNVAQIVPFLIGWLLETRKTKCSFFLVWRDQARTITKMKENICSGNNLAHKHPYFHTMLSWIALMFTPKSTLPTFWGKMCQLCFLGTEIYISNFQHRK